MNELPNKMYCHIEIECHRPSAIEYDIRIMENGKYIVCMFCYMEYDLSWYPEWINAFIGGVIVCSISSVQLPMLKSIVKPKN